jgi:hypothetical protein
VKWLEDQVLAFRKKHLKCGECDCGVKYPNIGCDTIKDCENEHFPNMTLRQAIAKAKPNMDKIDDVDKWVDSIRLGAVGERFYFSITEMENEILANLSDLDTGYGRRKWAISKQTGIPEDILTVLLKRLKLAGKVKLIMIWSECTGLPNGSGYCLEGSLNA